MIRDRILAAAQPSSGRSIGSGAVLLAAWSLLLGGCAGGAGLGPPPEPGREVMSFSEALYPGPGQSLYLRNDSETPITITEIVFSECLNVTGDCRLRDVPFVLEPGRWRRFYVVEPLEADRGFNYRYSFRYRAGRMTGAVADRTEAPPLISLGRTDDFEVLLDPRGTFVNLVSPGVRPDDTAEFAQSVTNTLYRFFQDSFDFVFFSSPDASGSTSVGGMTFRARNDARGIGVPIGSNTPSWGSNGRLRGALFLAQHQFLDTAIALHEIGHIWGQSILPESGDGHWGFAGIGGLLGGWEPGTLEPAGVGNWLARGPDGSPGFLIYGPNRDGVAQRLKTYAPLELYLMGLLPADSVPDFQIAERAEWVVEPAGVFRAALIRTVTMEEIVSRFGPREPAPQSGEEFRGVYVVVSAEPLTEGARELVHADIVEFSRPGARSEHRRYYNFWEATGGRATLVMDTLGDALLTPR